MTANESKTWIPKSGSEVHIQPPELSGDDSRLIDNFPVQEYPADHFGHQDFDTFYKFIISVDGAKKESDCRRTAQTIWDRLFDRSKSESYVLHEGEEPYLSYSLIDKSAKSTAGLVEMFRRRAWPAKNNGVKRQAKDTEKAQSIGQLAGLKPGPKQAINPWGVIVYIQNNHNNLESDDPRHPYLLSDEHMRYLKAFALGSIKSLSPPGVLEPAVTI